MSRDPWNDRDTKNRHRGLAREVFWEAHDPAEYQCPDCRRREADVLRPFEVHHKNGDPMDNREQNLVGVCRPCHNIREGKKPSIEEIENLRNVARDVRRKNSRRERDSFTTEQYGRPALKCPNCGDGYLHQNRVEVFVRHGEDSGNGDHVVVDYRDGFSADSSMEGNPSSRRDGMKLTFGCELCSVNHVTLNIVQHKGNEFVSWEING